MSSMVRRSAAAVRELLVGAAAGVAVPALDMGPLQGGLLRATHGRTAHEVAAGVVPVDYGYPAGWPQRYGVVDLTGATPSTAAVQAAINSRHTVRLTGPGVWRLGALSGFVAGQVLRVDQGAVVLQNDPAAHLLTIGADDVCIVGGEWRGVQVAEAARFLVFTDAAQPARRLALQGMRVTGAGAGQGWNNFAKFDTGCDDGRVMHCHVSALVGFASGNGYGVLVGDADGVAVELNTFTGSAAGGRHAVYLSGGCSVASVRRNRITGFRSDGITQWSQAGQPPCEENAIELNVVKACATVGVATSGAISIMGRSRGARIARNTIDASGSCGIKLDAAGVVDLLDTELDANKVTGSGFIGVDILGAVGGRLTGGLVRDSSQVAAGTHANVRFVSDGTTAPAEWVMEGVSVPASASARSGVQTNATPPTPVRLKFSGNAVGAGQVADYEFLGQVFTVDGIRRVEVLHNWPAINSGASVVQTFNPAALADMPAGANIECTYTGNTDGMTFEAQCLVAGVARVTFSNLSGVQKTPIGGSVVLSWVGAK